jgi:hypothetical protein
MQPSLGGGMGTPFRDLMFVENSYRPQKAARSIGSGVPNDSSRAVLRIDEQIGAPAEPAPRRRRGLDPGVLSETQLAGQAP